MKITIDGGVYDVQPNAMLIAARKEYDKAVEQRKKAARQREMWANAVNLYDKAMRNELDNKEAWEKLNRWKKSITIIDLKKKNLEDFYDETEGDSTGVGDSSESNTSTTGDS